MCNKLGGLLNVVWELSLAHSMATLTAAISFKTTPQHAQILSNPAAKKAHSLLQDPDCTSWDP